MTQATTIAPARETASAVRPPARRRLLLGPGLLVAIGMLGLTVLLSLAVGTADIPLPDVWSALVDPGSSYSDAVVQSRVPRTLLGLLCGAALATSGAVMQGISRNPLGDPSLLGVNVGAAAAIVTATAFFGATGAFGSVLIALPGALAAAAIVTALGAARRGVSPVRLVLAGAVVSAVLAAYIQAVTLNQPEVFDSYRFWVVGSLAGRSPDTAVQIAPFVLVGLLVALALGASINALGLGDDTATAIGANVARTRLIGIATTALLCAAATAGAGPIAFVGLAVPHVARAVTGNDHRWLIPYSLVLGSVLLLAADILGRIAARPSELMVGVVTAFVGAPVLLLAVRRLRER